MSREVFGFGLASSLSDPTIGYPSWNFSLLSTVAFFGLHINWDGTIVADPGLRVWNSATLTSMLSTAHASGTKVVVTIVLQDFATGTPNMCAGLINRAVTVKQTVAQVAAKKVDGVNVDYEGLNGTCQNGQTTRSMMTDFVRQLRAALPAGSYLSVDTYASSAADSLGFFDVQHLNAYTDSFFVMAYDLEYSNYRRTPLNCSSFCLGPTAPLAGYYYNDTSTASQYVAAVPASKVILGVPYYGRKACVKSAVANAYPIGAVVADSYLDAQGESSASGVQAGTYATHRDSRDPAGGERWDTWYNTSLGCTRELYWDDTVSLAAKYDLAIKRGLRGVGIWNLNYGGGAPELWSLLAGRFARCTGAGVSADSSSEPAGSTIALKASAIGCVKPKYEFWVQYPDKTWHLEQGWGGAAFSWNTAGLAPGVYNIHAWTNHSGTTWEAIGAMAITLTGCSTASLTPTSTKQPIGSTIAFTAGAAGCPDPIYEFWVQYPNGSWVLKQGWGGSTFSWSTSALAPGVYTVHAWANQQGAAPTLEAYGSASVTLTACTSASANPANPTQPAGSTLAFTASSTGCLNPKYEFWVQYPNKTWYLKQGWGDAAFSWNTTGLAPGVYTLHAWVNHGGATWEAIGATAVTLTGCTTASLSPSTTRQSIGSAVNFTAGSGGCPNPIYEFWAQYPNGSWVLKRGWGGATFSLSTSGLSPGLYTVHAWANQQGAAPSLEVYGSSAVTLFRPCSSAALNPAAGSAVVGGGSVKFAATSTGCSNPVYEFWLLDPAGTWHMMQTFSSTNTWTWNSAGSVKGTYTIHVWADERGTDASVHEAIGSATYTLK